MSAMLSVIIPTLNAADALPATADALLEGVGSGAICELILTDGGSTDRTAEIAEALGARWITGPPGRGGQLARGAAVARGDWLLFLHADTLLPPGWVAAVLAHMNADPEMAGYCRLAFRAQGPWPWFVAGWANARSRRLGLPYGDQGLLISRALYDRLGGMPPLPLMEDVAMARKLRGKLKVMPLTATTSAERYQAEGWARRGARNLLLVSRYLLGADPARLARAYARRD